ncbi:hypothetical protein D8Y22_11875 [Salinadaptatus halalkaliphilus]|uniref:Uncharacterized protein n=1 Tax=Salinadaptatus halalkaliphilus TaxID=2419781 RepID=A0A4S3TKH2_9EURY|nr:hypothetical protein [Salinadaptatus halalkaliphilus]THE64639.1 hypothetical protein D8Y22_11875 [Salinadaptatus halalkaliphilus]
MIGRLDDCLSPVATKTTLYHVVRLGLRVYVVSVVLVGTYSVFWIADIAGLIPNTLLSTIWIGIAVMGSIFLVLLVSLFFAARSSGR